MGFKPAPAKPRQTRVLLKSSAPLLKINHGCATSACEQKNQRSGKRTSLSILLLVLVDLLGVVPLVVLLTTTGAPATVSAVSIAAISIASNADGKESGNFGKHQPQQHHRPGQSAQPHKLSFHSGNDANGNKGSAGMLSLPFGDLYFTNKRNQELDGKAARKIGKISKRNVGEARITSNQDVTTLALAVDNSSSVAISNINSKFNNVYVTIGSSQIPNRFEPGNRFDPHPEPDD